jgi:AraC-like DNA-binding protein
MSTAKLLWQERRADSLYIESVWTCHAVEATSRAVIADPCICISFVRNNENTEVIIGGPKTRPRLQALPDGYTCTTIRLKPGVSFKNIHTDALINDTLSIQADGKARFKFDGIFFQFPEFDHAEKIIEDLFAVGCLDFKQPQNMRMQPRRTYSRHIKHFTGISPYKLHQLQRMHQALRLLRGGATVTDIVTELAFTDQAHFTHASKQFFGYTPKKLGELLQNP